MTDILKKIKSKALLKPESAAGKKISSINLFIDELSIVFTDGTYMNIKSELIYGDCQIQLNFLLPYEAKEQGVISEEEYEEWKQAEHAKAEANHLDKQRKEYERLKKMFEG